MERYLAERLQLYFDYWFERIQGGEAPEIPITRDGAAAPGVVIRADADEARVEVVEGILHVEAPDEATLKQIFMRYLRALDTKYWTPDIGYGGWFPRAKGEDPWLVWPDSW